MYMFCKKCGNEILENSVFCNFCGHKIENGGEQTKDSLSDEPSKKKINKSIIGILTIIIIVIITTTFIIKSNPLEAAINAINKDDYDKASNIYSGKIKGDKKQEKEFSEKLMLEIDKITNKYISNKTTYDEAIDEIEKIADFGLVRSKVNEAKREINNLNDSRIAFDTAIEFEKNSNYIDAIAQYNKVIEYDSENYANAQRKISDLSEKYKADVLIKCEEYEKNNDYKSTISLIDDALIILQDDGDLKSKKTIYSKLLEEQIAREEKEIAEKAKNEQLITVENTRILVQSTDYKTLYPDMFEVVIKNNSGKTIRSYKVSMLGWDSNGYPLKIKQSFLDNVGSYEFLGQADNVNVIDGKTFGKNSGWSLEEGHNISKTKAVVIEAEFYDDSIWENPYYEFFLKEFEGKPIGN